MARCPDIYHAGQPDGEERYGGLCAACFHRLPNSDRGALMKAAGGQWAGDPTREVRRTIFYPRLGWRSPLLWGFVGSALGTAAVECVRHWMGW